LDTFLDILIIKSGHDNCYMIYSLFLKGDGTLALVNMDNIIAEAVSLPNDSLREILNYVLAGGKGLRPSLVVYCARFGAHHPQEVYRVAAAIELVHLASLIHDDVMDQADIRRGKPSLHRTFGTLPAVLTGDYLFATAFELLSKSRKTVLHTVTSAIRNMCSGEIQQLSRQEAIIDLYYSYIGQKTASLFQAACSCGSILARLKRSQQDCLARFGWHLGMAYQIIDDYLDIFAPPGKMNKPCHKDLEQGIFTLPVIYFLQQNSQAQIWQQRIEQGLKPSEKDELVAIMRKKGCDSYTASIARKEISLAVEAIGNMPPVVARYELETMVGKVLTPLEEIERSQSVQH